MLPPMILRLRVGTAERPGHALWLPLFLIWLILVPFAVVALAITLLVDAALILIARPYHHYTLLLFRGLGLLGATRGLVVSIRSEEHVVDFDLV
jgi:hypothetical protein